MFEAVCKFVLEFRQMSLLVSCVAVSGACVVVLRWLSPAHSARIRAAGKPRSLMRHLLLNRLHHAVRSEDSRIA